MKIRETMNRKQLNVYQCIHKRSVNKNATKATTEIVEKPEEISIDA